MTCPYEDQNCPKVEDVKAAITEIKNDFRWMKYCMITITVFLATKFGAEFLEVFI